jgi:FAD/FMN-containing dehydrogenase|tara:strand:- start:113 stop:361 length:249 start_codon:yes stop_codon:yes gene_type:complete
VPDITDVVVPRSRIAEFVERANGLASEYGILLIAYGHAGDGNVRLHPIGEGADEFVKKVKELFIEIYELGISLAGRYRVSTA